MPTLNWIGKDKVINHHLRVSEYFKRNVIDKTMIKTILLFLFMNPFSMETGLKQVANYSVSEYGNPKFEEFSFWVNDKNEPVINSITEKKQKKAALSI